MDEFTLISRYFTRPARGAGVLVGVGDDGAVVRPSQGFDLVLTVDMLVEGRHFLAGTDPARLGHKALAVNLSDLAAMGARPRHALLAGALPDADPLWLEPFARGFFALADAHDVDVIGGDTTRGPRTLCVTLIGEVPQGAAITRSGAQVGDDVWVSGTLGDAMFALAVLEGRASAGALEWAQLHVRLEAPTPRVALGMALRGIATAAIDISDGLTGDLGHILARSGVGADVDLAQLPRSTALDAQLVGDAREHALGWLVAGGDDYELCFTAGVGSRDAVTAAATACATQVSRVGSITASSGLRLRDERGNSVATPHAFQHFGR